MYVYHELIYTVYSNVKATYGSIMRRLASALQIGFAALCSVRFACAARSAVFVNYAFYNKGIEAERNLRFFLRHGVMKSDDFDIEYGIVVKGPCSCEECKHPEKHVKSDCKDLITVRFEDNQGFDFGAHATMLDYLSSQGRLTQDYFIFLNCGVVGPIIPSYMPPSWHWVHAFVDKLVGDIGLVGTSIVCLPETDRGGFGPKVEGFAFALSSEALDIVRKHGTSFRQHESKVRAVLDGEFALTKVLMQHNIGIDCLLHAYQGINWFKKEEWKCNSNKYPSREKFYHGMSISPLEVVFHKEWWRKKGPVMLNYTEKYISWINNRKIYG